MQTDPAARVLVAAPAGAAREAVLADLAGNAVAVADWVVEQNLFTSAPVFQLTHSFRESPTGKEELKRDLPGLSPRRLSKLDRRGIIEPGSEVSPGDVLVGKVAPKGPRDFTAEDMLLHAIFGSVVEDVVDESLRYEFLDTGRVTAARLS